MKPRVSNHKTAALTREEVLVVIVVLAILVGVVLLSLRQPRDWAKEHWRKTTWCVNNLKQVGLAYRLWEGDNNDKYPM
jgi:type II secretory pathway pseudopilin PulG